MHLSKHIILCAILVIGSGILQSCENIVMTNPDIKTPVSPESTTSHIPNEVWQESINPTEFISINTIDSEKHRTTLSEPEPQTPDNVDILEGFLVGYVLTRQWITWPDGRIQLIIGVYRILPGGNVAVSIGTSIVNFDPDSESIDAATYRALDLDGDGTYNWEDPTPTGEPEHVD